MLFQQFSINEQLLTEIEHLKEENKRLKKTYWRDVIARVIVNLSIPQWFMSSMEESAAWVTLWLKNSWATLWLKYSCATLVTQVQLRDTVTQVQLRDTVTSTAAWLVPAAWSVCRCRISAQLLGQYQLTGQYPAVWSVPTAGSGPVRDVLDQPCRDLTARGVWSGLLCAIVKLTQ